MKTLYYCMGGGLGHLTRLIAFCHTFSLKPAIITNCSLCPQDHAGMKFTEIFTPPAHIQNDKVLLGQFVAGVIKKHHPERLFIDAFPAGILGELSGMAELDNVECIYLMRILQFKKYMQRVSGPLPVFSEIHLLETILDEQQQWLNNQSCTQIKPVALYDPIPVAVQPTCKPGYWLIVHSGKPEELIQLWDFARETAQLKDLTPDFIMISQGKRPDFLPPQVQHLNIYPASPYFADADHIFSAAGFNIMRQLKQFRKKHSVLPFPRALDDQFARLANHRQNSDTGTA